MNTSRALKYYCSAKALKAWVIFRLRHYKNHIFFKSVHILVPHTDMPLAVRD